MYPLIVPRDQSQDALAGRGYSAVIDVFGGMKLAAYPPQLCDRFFGRVNRIGESAYVREQQGLKFVPLDVRKYPGLVPRPIHSVVYFLEYTPFQLFRGIRAFASEPIEVDQRGYAVEIP